MSLTSYRAAPSRANKGAIREATGDGKAILKLIAK